MDPLHAVAPVDTAEIAQRSDQVKHSRAWIVVSAVEVAIATIAVLRDVWIPSLVLLVMAVVSLVIRRKGFRSLGLTRFSGWGLVGKVFALALAWSAFQFSVTMPIANHLSGTKQDLEPFENLQGNVGLLIVLIVASWLLGAFGEELAFRGYLLTRTREAVGSGRAGWPVAVLLSSILFGLAHSEQGFIGVLIVCLDGIYFSFLRLHFKTLWASVLAHGFNNTIGFIAFFVVGPLYGLW